MSESSVFSLENIQTIAVIGSGVMGQGIAQVCASAGFIVILADINESVLKGAHKSILAQLNKLVEKGKITREAADATSGKITLSTEPEQIKADLFIEAILEDLRIKQNLFSKIAAQNSVTAIFASNTSTLPITRIAAEIPYPERVIGLHFFNPAPIMKLVEIIPGANTAPEVIAVMQELTSKLGKTAVSVKDEPGFIVNRVARHFYLESLLLLEEKVADFEEIDEILKAYGFKMGPFELMDLIGVETNHSVTKSLYHSFFEDEKFRPSRIQQNKVDAGHYGRKTGKGFYTYSKDKE
jgi:3-hydroxybutyryl-CoA dehydrogenase